MIIKDIDLCGLGNGLVDLQYEVSDDELMGMNLKKGEMRLAASGEQVALLAKLSRRKHNRCSGGSAANTIIAFSQFGGKAAYKTILGDDDFGHFYAAEFRELGIELNTLHIKEDPTGTCLVLITPDSERTMFTHLGATSHFGPDNVNENIIARSKWLYIEGYKFSEASGAESIYKSIDYAKKYNTRIAVTFSDAFIIELFKDKLDYVVNNADLIFCNETEAKAYTKTDYIEEAFKKLGGICPNLALTKGGDGSLIRWEGKDYDIPVYPAQVKDTTGAGDMYAAGFFYGILYSGSAEKAGHLAAIASAKVVSQFGARLSSESRDDIIIIYNNLDF